jgi:PhoH-like ATPase
LKRQVVLVTKDINMRLKAKEQACPRRGLPQRPAHRRHPPAGQGLQVVPGSFWERVGECDSETHGRDTVHVIDANLLEGIHVNQYLIDEENFFAARVLSHDSQKIRIKDLGRERLMSQGVGFIPRTSIRAWRLMRCSIRTSTW